MAVFFVIQNLLLNDNINANSIIKSLVIGLVLGIVSGFLFGLIIGYFSSSKFVDRTTRIETRPDENILFQTPANHFKGMEGVGGRLYLTNKRLVFISHKLNVQNHELSIDLGNIISIDRYKNAGLLNNGLIVTSRNNNVDKFAVEQAEEWVRKLK